MNHVALTGLAALAAAGALWELTRLRWRWIWSLRRTSSGTAVAGAVVPVVRWSREDAPPGRYEHLLDAAGRGSVPDAAALGQRRRQGLVVGAAWAGALAWIAGAGPPVAAAASVAAGACGHALPLLVLRGAARRRAAALRETLPEAIELLAVALGCGLPLAESFAVAGRWTGDPVAAGLRAAATDLVRGAGTELVLERFAREHPVEEVRALLAIVRRSRQHGTPAAGPLRALADSARQERARRAVEHAARAAPRVQLVAALLLVPAALCVLAAALVAGAA